MVKLLSLVLHHLLSETVVHPEDIVQHFDTHYRQAENSLRQDQSHIGLGLGRLEGFVH